jgi:hypothetical protein
LLGDVGAFAMFFALWVCLAEVCSSLGVIFDLFTLVYATHLQLPLHIRKRFYLQPPLKSIFPNTPLHYISRKLLISARMLQKRRNCVVMTGE